MLHLRTLGALALLDGERPVLSDQRRRLAVLAMVAAAGDRGLSRDRLVSFLWPESATGSARHALHQLLYYLRRDVHPDLFLGTDPLRLNPQVVDSDIAGFDQALASGDLQRAVTLYRGPFLDGFFLSEAPEFEEWVESERARLSHACQGALHRLARAADEQGEVTVAIERWRVLKLASPLDPRAVLGLMRALAAGGDPAGALREARRYEQVVADELDGTPAPDVVAYAGELRRRGYATPPPEPGDTPDPGRAPGGAGAEPTFAGRYRLAGRAARGGMATVFLATDIRHERRVALKLLHATPAESGGTERFLHEIRITAQLQHPYVLPIFDSGETDGRLWFATPWIEGESLRARIRRERRLPLDTALEIAGQCLAALGHAHRHGILHRDVKPENILLHEGGALLADFGIATVMGRAADEQLTDPAVAIGTPRYMSPEHASGGTVDPRSDLFSLAAVLFEMLCGVPCADFAHLEQRDRDLARQLAAIRPAIPSPIIAALLRALQWDARLRFASAEEFAAALTAAPTRSPLRRLPRTLRVAGLVGLALVLAAAASQHWRRAAPALDPDLLLVLPFRVAVTDGALREVGDGALDLLYARMQNADDVAMVEPQAVRAALRGGRPGLDEAETLRLGDRFRAGRILQGAVVGSREGILLTATLRDRVGRQPPVQASVAGPADSLVALFDRLTAELVLRSAGEQEYRLKDLASRSLPALRSYLAGQAAYRSGRYDSAVAHFGRAVTLDSTFALAGLGFMLAAEYGAVEPVDRAVVARARTARRTTGRLAPRDLRLLDFMEGQGTATLYEGVQLWEQAVAELPERKEAWFELGDELFHWGERLGIPDAAARSARALDRALALDSVFAPALEHRVALALRTDDAARVGILGKRYVAAHPGAPGSDYVRWAMVSLLGDADAQAAFRRQLDQVSNTTLYHIAHSAQQLVVRLADADRAIGVLEQRAAEPGRAPIPPEAFSIAVLRRTYLLDRGLAHRAARLPESRPLEACGPDCPERIYLPIVEGRGAIYDALYWDGDSATAARAAAKIAARVALPGTSSDARSRHYADLCALEHWKLAQRDTLTVRNSLATLRDRATPVRAGGSGDAEDNVLCAATLEVLLGTVAGSPDSAAVARLDSIQLRGSWPFYVYHTLGTIALARGREAQGDLREALAVIRRREYGVGVPPFFTTLLREEGRLAAALGDTAVAARAYRHYLALRAGADPPLAIHDARIRAELLAMPRGSAPRPRDSRAYRGGR